MTITDTALREHATRVLLGTGITPDQALAVAAGHQPVTESAPAALRDGWTAADTVRTTP